MGGMWLPVSRNESTFSSFRRVFVKRVVGCMSHTRMYFIHMHTRTNTHELHAPTKAKAKTRPPRKRKRTRKRRRDLHESERTSTCPHTGLQLVRTQDFNLSAHRTSTCPHTRLQLVRTQDFNLSAHRTSTCPHTHKCTDADFNLSARH